MRLENYSDGFKINLTNAVVAAQRLSQGLPKAMSSKEPTQATLPSRSPPLPVSENAFVCGIHLAPMAHPHVAMTSEVPWTSLPSL